MAEETQGAVKAIQVEVLINAIKEMEGYHEGSLSHKNNNPCNIRAVGDLGWGSGFGKFSTYRKGVTRCIRTIKWYSDRDATLAGMIFSFAPASDGNQPATYTNFITSKTGIKASDKLNDILIF